MLRPAPLGAVAQSYPTKPVTVIVPFAAGGPTDALARVLTARMGEALGQTMIVENVGGRRRHDRRQQGRQGDARRLHDPVRAHGHPRGEHRAVQVAALRQPEGLRADRARACTNPMGAGGQEGPAGQGLQGVRGLCEGQPEEGAVRHGRHRRRLASRWPDAEQHDEGRRAGDPLQGYRTGAERSGERPVRLHGRPRP